MIAIENAPENCCSTIDEKSAELGSICLLYRTGKRWRSSWCHMIQNTKMESSGVPARFLKETLQLHNCFSLTCTERGARPFDGHLPPTNQLGSFNTIPNLHWIKTRDTFYDNYKLQKKRLSKYFPCQFLQVSSVLTLRIILIDSLMVTWAPPHTICIPLLITFW